MLTLIIYSAERGIIIRSVFELFLKDKLVTSPKGES